VTAARWKVSADTGGTFTDCLALSPDGEVCRSKVLSSSALRARVTATGGDGLELEGLGELASSLLDGWTLRRLGGDDEWVSAASWDRDARRLELARSGSAMLPGDLVELRCPEEAPILAAVVALGVRWEDGLPPLDLRLATTLGTNALLERRGAKTALFLTAGFGDLLRIGDQSRPDLFALEIVRPEPLYEAVVEVPGRLDAGGDELRPLDAEAIRDRIDGLRAAGFESAAVCLLHAHRNGEHEARLADRLRSAGLPHVSVSHELSPLQGYLNRARTTLVDAYLAPVLGRYLERIRSALSAASRILVMTSAGGLTGVETFRAKDGLLSGPAGGVVGAGRAGERSGLSRLLTFDMGGTSTDVARWHGQASLVFEHRVGDALLLAPAVDVETVAAGGGSVCWFDGDRIRVGPESGGASPGPACYGAGGPLTLTDVNLLRGWIDPGSFRVPLVPEASSAALGRLRGEVERATGSAPRQEELLDGFRRIADERMAEAIRRVSVRRGFDPREHVLVAFGGAGGQHACAVAEILGIDEILVPEDAGLLSAVGLGAARIERVAGQQLLAPLLEAEAELPARLEGLAAEALAFLEREGVPRSRATVARRLAFLRYAGQDESVELELEESRESWRASSLRALFEERYRELYGYLPPERQLELVALRVVARERAASPGASPPAPDSLVPQAVGAHRARFGSTWRDIPVFDRETLLPGSRLAGPALVREAHGTTVVGEGWGVRVTGTDGRATTDLHVTRNP